MELTIDKMMSRENGVQLNEITIRRATVEDVAVIHALLSELEETLELTSKVKRKEEDLQRFGFSGTPCFEALIAWRGTDAVGLALFFQEFSSWKGVAGVYVQDLYVSADVRGTGLGAKLMKAVYEQARNWGARYCRLTVHGDNEVAFSFYERLGFRAVRNENVLVFDGL